jgi:hypothetical protein
MAELHFRSMDAPQNKNDITNRFGDRNFILAVCKCCIRYCDRLEVIRNFRSLNNGGNPFRVNGIIGNRK